MFKITKCGVTVSSVLDQRTINKDGLYPVKIKVYYQRKPKYYSVGITLSKERWDAIPSGKSRDNKYLEEQIGKYYLQIVKIMEFLTDQGTFSFDRLDNQLGRGVGGSLNDMFRAQIQLLQEGEKYGTMGSMKSTLASIERYKRRDVAFRDVTVQWLQDYERFCTSTMSQATTAIYMRNIRKVINIAKTAGTIRESDYPFGRGKFQIKEGVGKKKALTKEQLKAIADYTSWNNSTIFYRDLWMFIYFCNGINVADLINLKFENIQNDEISFIRKKTEGRTHEAKRIYAPITPEMQRIIDKWGNTPRPENYIFPFMEEGDTAWDYEKKRKNLTHVINDHMKIIGKELNIGVITTYVARHTYATVLRNEGVSASQISPSLGHTSVKTTEIYLADLGVKERAHNASLLSF